MAIARILLSSIFVLYLAFPGVALAAVDAESVVQGKCTACHSSERIREASKTKAEWEILVDEEIERGASLNQAEQVAVVDWLAANYGSGEAIPVQDVTQNTALTTAETTTDTLPFSEQAETGVELWQFLISGGALMSGGAWMRRRR